MTKRFYCGRIQIFYRDRMKGASTMDDKLFDSELRILEILWRAAR